MTKAIECYYTLNYNNNTAELNAWNVETNELVAWRKLWDITPATAIMVHDDIEHMFEHRNDYTVDLITIAESIGLITGDVVYVGRLTISK